MRPPYPLFGKKLSLRCDDRELLLRRLGLLERLELRLEEVDRFGAERDFVLLLLDRLFVEFDFLDELVLSELVLGALSFGDVRFGMTGVETDCLGVTRAPLSLGATGTLALRFGLP